MKTMINSLLLTLALCASLLAQNLPKPDKSKMEIFKHWVGHWKGEGTMQQGQGPAGKSSVDENIEMKLDGMIVVVEGVGRKDEGTADEKIVHHAFGILSYDQVSKTYKFKTYLSDGRSTDAWFEVAGESRYRWGFDVPSGKIKYTINLDTSAGKWNEIGEFSPDGTTWHKFFDMNLVKIK